MDSKSAFDSFNDINHISSFQLDFNETRKLNLELKEGFSKQVFFYQFFYLNLSKKRLEKVKAPVKIMQFQSYSGETIFELNLFTNNSVGFNSDFYEGTIIFEHLLRGSHWIVLEIQFFLQELCYHMCLIKTRKLFPKGCKLYKS